MVIKEPAKVVRPSVIGQRHSHQAQGWVGLIHAPRDGHRRRCEACETRTTPDVKAIPQAICRPLRAASPRAPAPCKLGQHALKCRLAAKGPQSALVGRLETKTQEIERCAGRIEASSGDGAVRAVPCARATLYRP